MLIPVILCVVLIVLYALLRVALAPLVLVAVMVLSALAALGLGGWTSVHLLGMPALDYTTGPWIWWRADVDCNEVRHR